MKNIFFIALISSLVPSVAFAAGHTQADVDVAKAKCAETYKATTTDGILARGQCMLRIDIIVLAERQAAGDKSVEVELKAMRGKLEGIESTLKVIKDAQVAQATQETAAARQPPKKEESPPKKAQPATTAAPAPVQPPAFPAGTPGAPYVVMEMPGQYAASTFPIPGMISRVRLMYLKMAVGMWFSHYGLTQRLVRVVVYKNGQPLAIVHPGNRYEEFYADMNNDGRPDATPYRGVDPSFVDTIFVGYREDDQISVDYLIPSGNMIAIPGLPPQMLWRTAIRVGPYSYDGFGDWAQFLYIGGGKRVF